MPDKQSILDHFGGDFTAFYSRCLPDMKRGKANCPFHDCDSRSLSVDTKTGLFRCHFPGCAASGDVFKFYGLKHGINGDFPKVLAGIAADFGISGNGANPHQEPTRKLVKRYAYADADGNILFYKNRYEPKGFSVSRPDGNGGIISGLGDVQPVLYNRPEILDAELVFVVEGEKDADNLNSIGITATTNFDGAGKWKENYSKDLAGKHVVIVPDDDEAGRAHAQLVAESLHGAARSIRILQLPNPNGVKGFDVSDWLAAQPDQDEAANHLSLMSKDASEWTPPAETQPATESPWTRAVIDFDTLRKIQLPERRSFLFPWLTEQSMTLVYSWRGTGKSFFTLGIINAVTRGESFGPWEAVEPVPCLYLDGEMPAGMLQERAEGMGIGGPGTKTGPADFNELCP
jgi:hypothetical protein